jgi:hypothetical protein
VGVALQEFLQRRRHKEHTCTRIGCLTARVHQPGRFSDPEALSRAGSKDPIKVQANLTSEENNPWLQR